MGYYMCSKISIKMNKKKMIIGKMIYLLKTKHKIFPLYIPNNQQIGTSKECNLGQKKSQNTKWNIIYMFHNKKKTKIKRLLWKYFIIKQLKWKKNDQIYQINLVRSCKWRKYGIDSLCLCVFLLFWWVVGWVWWGGGRGVKKERADRWLRRWLWLGWWVGVATLGESKEE